MQDNKKLITAKLIQQLRIY